MTKCNFIQNVEKQSRDSEELQLALQIINHGMGSGTQKIKALRAAGYRIGNVDSYAHLSVTCSCD